MKPGTKGGNSSTVQSAGATLHVEVDGSGEPVTVVAHGLTNSRRELSALTPLLKGSVVRFDLRGHGLSSVPPTGYAISDFAADLDAVATAYAATRAVGTSLGAAAICHLLADDPRRFEKIVLVLPAFLDRPIEDRGGLLRVAELLETLPKEQAVEAIAHATGRDETYERAPWLRDLDRMLWEDLNPIGAARAIRGVIGQIAVSDRELLRRVEAQVLIICREGDQIHPAEVGRVLHEIFTTSELIVLGGEEELLAAIPQLALRAAEFLA
jgi:3-oxoadipate enol-lactonase